MSSLPEEPRPVSAKSAMGVGYSIDTDMSARQRLLEEAIKITTSDRNKSYGNPEDNFLNIAAYWTQYWRMRSQTLRSADVFFGANDVAQMMILMKMARLATNPTHRDSTLDVAGYAACHADIQESMAKRKEETKTQYYESTKNPTNTK